MKGIKKRNEYIEDLGAVYTHTPKAVFAAVLVSYLRNAHGIAAEDVAAEIVKEWAVLHENEIVPQPPVSLDNMRAIDERYAKHLRDMEEQRNKIS